MTSTPDLKDICRIEAPYRREVVLQDALFDSGMRLLRVRIREGHRFTLLDIDAETARALAAAMLEWAECSERDAAGGGSAIA